MTILPTVHSYCCITDVAVVATRNVAQVCVANDTQSFNGGPIAHGAAFDGHNESSQTLIAVLRSVLVVAVAKGLHIVASIKVFGPRVFFNVSPHQVVVRVRLGRSLGVQWRSTPAADE